MDSRGWTAFDEREPEESDCLYGYLLIWHVFRGVVAVPWEKRRYTQMYTHWKRMPRKGWIASADRLPTADEGDVQHCVLARSETDGFRVTGWHQFRHHTHYTHWMPTPEAPENGKIYQQRF